MYFDYLDYFDLLRELARGLGYFATRPRLRLALYYYFDYGETKTRVFRFRELAGRGCSTSEPHH